MAKKTRQRKSQGRSKTLKKRAPRRAVRTTRSSVAQKRTAVRRIRSKPSVSARQVRQVAQQVVRPSSRVQAKEQQGTFIGTIQHYYTHLGVGVLDVQGEPVAVGDRIRVKGATTDFTQTVQSMQLNHQSAQRAAKGESVGLKVDQHVRQHDKVYRL